MRNKKIKILFLIDQFVLAGGTEKQLILLAENLPRNIFEPLIGVLYKTGYQNSLKIKTPIVNFNWSSTPLVKNISLLWRLRNYLGKEKVDILQTHFVDSTIYGAWAVRLCKNRPYLITTRRDLYYWMQDEPWSFRILRNTARWTDCILVNSQSAFKECQRLEDIPLEKITVIPNAVEIQRFNGISSHEAKKIVGLEGEFPVIGVVGNFRPLKGLISFLEAAARVYLKIPTARFVLVGEGSQEDELKVQCHELEIQSQVKFFTGYPNIPIAIAAFDVAVQPSLSESSSNVLLEYMAAGRPIVATRVGDAEKVIEDGYEGLLVTPGNPEELSKAILTLCRDKPKADEMGKRAREKVGANWSCSKILDTYVNFYQELLQQRNQNK